MGSDLRLNKQQLQAIKHGKGPVLIIAGAGTGKTTVITERVKHLILDEKVKPQEILALTFTEKASQEMMERVDVAMPYGYTQMWVSTFHAFCDKILRNEALQIGLDPRYKLLTEAETIRFLRDKLFEFDLLYFRPLGNPTKFISALLQHFSRLSDEDIVPSQYLTWAKKIKQKAKSSEEKLESQKWQELANAYQRYEELKIKESYMDFSDLIANTLKLFRERPNVCKQYKKKFKYVLVDEFQDTNVAQYELIKLLAPPSKQSNLTAVGDDSQSIYKFRGAAISNILSFKDDYKYAKMVVLTENYRSTQSILDAAYRLIQNNNPDTLEAKLKIDKNLKSVMGKGFKPEFIHADRVENEADLVGKKILDLVEKEKRIFSDFAVLVRANSHADSFIRSFSRMGIPHQFLGPAKLFQQPEVKEIIAYLKVLYNLEDSAAMYKVLTMDNLGMEAEDVSQLANHARKHNLSLFESAVNLASLEQVSISKESKQKLQKLVDMIHKHLKLVPRETVGQITYYFLDETGVLKMMLDPKDAKEEQKAYNLSKFFEKIKTYEVEHEDSSVFAVVDWIDLLSEVGESPMAADFDWTRENAVNILTVHSSKGLEFPVVFVVNLVAQRFPTIERREQIPIPDELIKELLPSGDYHLQEERRLFYVASTRAKERLFVTASDYYGEGKREKKLSPFVFEMFGEDALEGEKDNVKVQQLSIVDFSPGLKIGTDELLTKASTARPPFAVNYLSFSQIETFGFCPLHYKLRYILHIPTPPLASLSFGSSLHLIMQEFNRLLICGNPLFKSTPKVEMLMFELLNKHWVNVGYSSKKHEEQMKKRGQEYLKNYLKSKLYNPHNPPKLLEQKFKFPLDGCQIGGVIDRIDATQKGIEIIDYKTTDFLNKDLPGENELKKNLQLSIYGLAATRPIHDLLGKKPEEITLSLYFFDLGVKISTIRTQNELKEAEEEIIKLKQQIEISDFACNKNYFCKNCEYSMFCEVDS